jgi:hypothetical protein
MGDRDLLWLLEFCTIYKPTKNFQVVFNKSLFCCSQLIQDKSLRSKVIQFDDQYCLKRVSKSNEWSEVPCEELDNMRYGSLFPGANGLLVAKG